MDIETIPDQIADHRRPWTTSAATDSLSQRPLRIVQMNTWAKAGGAAKVAQRLHEALRACGHDSRLLTGFGQEDHGSMQPLISSWPRWKQLLRRATLAIEDVSALQYLCLWWSRDLVEHPWVQSADLVHLHNVHGGYFSPSILPQLSQRLPVVWTLHDMWSLTGHCAYAFDCERWKTGCGRCPHLETYPDLWWDRTAFLWKTKQRLYAKSRLTIVTPSRWLQDLVRQSPLLRQFAVYHIPYGIDLSVWVKHPQREARHRLGLPDDQRLLLFVAEALDEPRKGGRMLLEALPRLSAQTRSTLGLVTVGRGGDRLPLPSGTRHVDFGVVTDETRLSWIYSAVDCLVCPSQLDNLPNTILEGAACGLPAVASAVGGIADVVRHLETGYLARPNDPSDLANGISQLMEQEALRHRLSEACRQMIHAEYSMELHVQRYLALFYQELAAQGQTRGHARQP